MANPVNPIDYATEDLATFLAKTVDNGTYNDVLTTLKVDEAGNATAATQIPEAIGQLWGNVVDDFFQASYPYVREVATGTLTGPFTFDGTVTLDSASPILTVGDGAGSPDVIIDKDGAGEGDLIFQTAGVQSWRVVNDASENLVFKRGAGDFTTFTFSQSSGKGTFSGAFQVGGASTFQGDIDTSTDVTMTWGDGTGTAQTGNIFTKADAGNVVTDEWRSGGVASANVRYALEMNSVESLNWRVYSGVGVFLGNAMTLTWNGSSHTNTELQVQGFRAFQDGRVSGDFTMDADLNHDGTNAGFFGSTPIAQPSITGSRGGNAALASLLTELERLGLIVDNTTA
jgi:hypothetical protein